VNKAGFVFSLIGGVLAILFSVLLVVTGPYFFAGDDIAEFANENGDDLLPIVRNVGAYNDVPMFWETDLDEFVTGYSKVIQKLDAQKLRDIGDEYEMEAFDDLALIWQDIEEYIPKLKICVLACLIASVIALAGAAIARSARIAGGVLVLAAAGLLLIFSLLASSILPMALASLLLIAGGLMQLARPKPVGEVAK
jgi:hypothetical protein